METLPLSDTKSQVSSSIPKSRRRTGKSRLAKSIAKHNCKETFGSLSPEECARLGGYFLPLGSLIKVELFLSREFQWKKARLMSRETNHHHVWVVLQVSMGKSQGPFKLLVHFLPHNRLEVCLNPEQVYPHMDLKEVCAFWVQNYELKSMSFPYRVVEHSKQEGPKRKLFQ